MNRRRRTIVTGVLAASALALGAAPAWSSGPGSPTLPEAAPDGAATNAPKPLGVSAGLRGATGTVDVTVRLAAPTIAQTVPEGAVAKRQVPSRAAQRATKAKVTSQQDTFARQAGRLTHPLPPTAEVP